MSLESEIKKYKLFIELSKLENWLKIKRIFLINKMSNRVFERSSDPFETVNHKNQQKLLQENEMLNKSQKTKRWTVDEYIYRCPLIIFLFTTFLFYLITFESIHIFTYYLTY